MTLALEKPGKQALLPGASPVSGVVPPTHARFGEPGGNPINLDGRPRGSHSIRAKVRRKLRKGWENDKEAIDAGEEPLGDLARKYGDDLLDAVERLDTERIEAILKLIAEAEGKPKEIIEHQGGSTVTLALQTSSLPRMELCECCLAKLEERELIAAREALPPHAT